jgi:hypothetical protein
MCFLVKIHLDIECFALDLLVYIQKMCFQRHLLSATTIIVKGTMCPLADFLFIF